MINQYVQQVTANVSEYISKYRPRSFSDWISYTAFFLTAFALVYAVIWRQKDLLINDIKALIAEGRSLPTWDERSEGKLPQWLNWSEAKLHRKSLRQLLELRKSMKRYVQVHYKMMNDEIEKGTADWI